MKLPSSYMSGQEWHTCCSCSGAALLEIMISVVLIATAAATALMGIRLCTSAQSRSEKRTVASRLAQERLGELRVSQDQTAGESSGSFQASYESFRWSLLIEPPGDMLPFRQVRLLVQDAATPPNTIYTLWTVLP